MEDQEQDFPREIQMTEHPNVEEKTSKNSKSKKRPLKHLDENHFETRSKKVKLDDHFKSFQFHIEQDGLTLGCVSEIKDYEVVVSLADGVKGKISITEIGDDYTKKLQKLVSGQLEEDGTKLLSLHDIFHLGSVVRCCITQSELISKKKTFSLTVNPRIVNRDIIKLKYGNMITGVVSSCEDHGYIVDIGVKNVTAFLPIKETTKFVESNEENFADNVQISIGSYLTCMVENKNSENKSETRDRSDNLTVNLTIDPNKISNSFQLKISLQSLLPGTPVKCSVVSKENNCLLVKINSFEGIIFHTHLSKNIDHYNVDQELIASVLYVQPSTKYVVLTQLKHLMNPNKFEVLFDGFEVGNILSDINVAKMDSKFGLYFKLSDTVNGLVKKSQLSDKDAVTLKDFKKGQTVTGRVVGFNYLENVVMLTLRESIINMVYYNYDDIKSGQIVECTAKMFHKGALVVKVMGKISGYIPSMHLSDIPLINPEKKFKAGKILKCRVLIVKPNDMKLILTNKKMLVKSKHAVPANFSDVKLNSVITGFIASIKPQGLLVVFCENVKGWVPKQELSYSEVSDNFTEQFYIGQVVNCKVLSCNPEKQKMVLSLKVGKQNDTDDVKNKVSNEDSKISKCSKISKKSETEQLKSVALTTISNKSKDDASNTNVAKSSEDNKMKKNKSVPSSNCLVLNVDEEFTWDGDNNVQNDVIVTNPDSHDNATKSEIISIARKKDLNSNEKRLELERATLMEPNSSLVWLNLLAFDIESGEIERAREVGVRAIKTISYREEKEKLNVWMGCINMEHQYGNEESLKEVTDSALKCCDPYRIYCHMRDMYSADQKVEKAEEICKILLKKYKTNPDVWVSYGQILFKFHRLDQARLVMTESLDRTDKKHYIELVTKYALLESKYGVPENAETLFESLITGHPKRTDVWSMYIDLCVKQCRIEQARSLLQRCTKLSLPAKKIKFLMKKFLNFELRHGTEAAVEEVKEMSKSLIADELTDD